MNEVSRAVPTVLVPIDEVNNELRVTDYILDRLSEDERINFENELQQNDNLRCALEDELALAEQIRNSQDKSHFELAPQDISFKKFSVLLEEDELQRNTKRQVSSRFNKRYLRIISGAVAASFVVTATFVLMPNNQLEDYRKDQFVTLSDGDQHIMENSDKHLFSVVFNPNLSKLERNKFIKDLNFELVSGPLDGQTYLVRANSQLESTRVKEIQSLEQVLFFEPAVLGKTDEAK